MEIRHLILKLMFVFFNFCVGSCVKCVKSKSVTNLAEIAGDAQLDAAGHPLPLVPTTEGPLGPVMVGHVDVAIAVPVIDVEAIEAGLEAEEGAVGGAVDAPVGRAAEAQTNPLEDI